MEISRAEVHFTEGASAALIARGNLQDRSLSNGVLHLEGKLGSKLLPADIDYKRVLVHADFRGPINRLSHSGVVEVDGVLIPRTTNLNVRAQWRGQQTDLEHFTASIIAGKSLLSMGGSAKAEQGQAGLRFEELSLTQANELLYSLEWPFTVSLDRDQLRSKAASRQWLLVLQPVHWQGPQRSLALEADVAWPSHGTFRSAVDHFDTALFAGFFRTAPPSFRFDQLNLAGQWSNGPVQFQMEVSGELPVKDQQPLAAQVRAHGDAEGLVVEQFQVTSGPVSVIFGHGSFPVRADPTNSSRVLVVDDRQPSGSARPDGAEAGPLGRNLLSEFGSGQGGADRLTIRSGEYISEQGKQTYSQEYRLSKDWSIVGEYDRFGVFNAELKWRVYSR
jgi:hypothetical protein